MVPLGNIEYNIQMQKVETKLESIIPEGFQPPSTEVVVFIVGLMSYVDQNGRIARYGDNNIVHFNIRPANTDPLFFYSFYFEHPTQYPNGTYLLGGVDRAHETRKIYGEQYDLYRSYELIYDPNKGFRVLAIQTATPSVFDGKGAIRLWESQMSKNGIQRLSRRIHTST